MADDIVTRLHDWQAIIDESKGDAVVVMLSGRVFGEAADEIERLRALITEYAAAWQPWAEMRSASVDEWTLVADRLEAAQQALIKEAHRG